MPGGRRARGSGQAYALLLLYRLWQRVAELETRPPVTTALIAVMLLVFGIGSAGKGGARALPPHLSTPVRAVQAVLDVRRSCLRPADVLFNGERHRLLLSSLIHLDEAHLLYNMLSFVHKGVTLETQMGSAPFAALIVYLAFVAHVLYCAVALALSAAAASPQLLNSCVAGFSGVLFGLGTVLSSSAEHRDAARSIFVRDPPALFSSPHPLRLRPPALPR